MIVVLVGVLGAAGCLFPSFDDVRKKPDNGDTSGTTSSSSSSSSSSSGSDSGGPTGTVSSTISCDDDTCSAPGQFCCATDKVFDISNDCTATGSEKTCVNQDNSQGLVMRCDGNEDCVLGFFCCFTEGVGSACQRECTADNQMCNTKGGACVSAQTSCSGPTKGGVKTCK